VLAALADLHEVDDHTEINDRTSESPGLVSIANVPEPVLAAGSVGIDASSIEPTGIDAPAFDLHGSGSLSIDVDFDAFATNDISDLNDINDVMETHVDDRLLEAGETVERPRFDLEPRARVERPPWFKTVPDPDEPTATAAPRPGRDSVSVRLERGLAGFGEYLVLEGALTRAQLYQVLRSQDWERLRLGEAAVRLGYVTERRVARLLERYKATFAPAAELVSV
jgi:hypothetical protein